MKTVAGFTLIELMLVIAIVAILGTIGLPAYQGYLQKAALTDMLQAMVPYKTGVELCALEQGNLNGCSAGSQGVPSGRTSRYVSAVAVQQGIIALTGQQTLQGLTLTLTPGRDSSGAITWTRLCRLDADNSALESACREVFRFADAEG